MFKRNEKSSFKSIFTVVILIGVGILMAWGMLGTSIDAEEDMLKISGLHSQKIAYEDIASVSLEENLPTITARTGGFSLGGKRLGNFATTEYGTVKLFLFNSVSPFIYIEKADGKLLIINQKESEDTKDLFNKLKNKRVGGGNQGDLSGNGKNGGKSK